MAPRRAKASARRIGCFLWRLWCLLKKIFKFLVVWLKQKKIENSFCNTIFIIIIKQKLLIKTLKPTFFVKFTRVAKQIKISFLFSYFASQKIDYFEFYKNLKLNQHFSTLNSSALLGGDSVGRSSERRCQWQRRPSERRSSPLGSHWPGESRPDWSFDWWPSSRSNKKKLKHSYDT